MGYTDLIGTDDSSALAREQASAEIIKEIPQASACLTLMKKLQNMSAKQYKMPVLSALPTAYWVDGIGEVGFQGEVTGLKQTTKMAWANKYITAEEIAVIVPIPQQILDDSAYDIWAEIKPAIAEAFGVLIDQTILYGTNAPTGFPDCVYDQIVAASNTVEYDSTSEDYDLYDRIWGVDGVLQKVRSMGYRPNGMMAGLTMEGMLDGLRDANGNPIQLVANPQGQEGVYTIKGKKVMVPINGAFDETVAFMFAGAWDKAVYAFRQDMTFDIATEATIHDADGLPQYNLFQQDMRALRCVMRLGWQVPNPINRIIADPDSQCAFAALIPPAEE